jgi:hypothetical protein
VQLLSEAMEAPSVQVCESAKGIEEGAVHGCGKQSNVRGDSLPM